MTVCEPRRIDIGRMGTRSAKKGRQTFTLPEYTSQYRYGTLPVNIGKCVTNRQAAQQRCDGALQARENHRNLALAGQVRLPDPIDRLAGHDALSAIGSACRGRQATAGG